jgi:fatty-acyl-CoA synthase
MSNTRQPPAYTYGGMVRANAQRVGARPAIIFDGQTTTWKELDRIADTYAKALLASGIKRGTMVAIHCANRPEWLFVAIGCARIGARLGPLNTFHRDAEITQQMQHSKPDILFVIDRIRRNTYGEMWQRLLPELAAGGAAGSGKAGRFALFPTLRDVVQLRGEPMPGTGSLEAWLKAGEAVSDADLAAAERAVSPEDDLFIMYTSGSTGVPKGVRMIHKDIMGNDFKIGERQGLTEEDVTWIATPMFYGLSTINAIPAIWTHGGGILLQETFDAGESLALIEKYRPTTYVSLANMTRALYFHEDRPRRDISSLKKGIAGFSTEDLKLAIEGLGITNCCAMYGLTETYGNCFITDWQDSVEVRTTSQGKVVEGWEWRIVDDDGQPVKEGELGLLEVKGAATPGYLENDAANKEAFCEDGFFRTGDIVSMGRDGRLRFNSRKKEILKIGGVNIAPAEVENIIGLHPAVEECHIVGVPDATKGELMAAFVDVGESQVKESDIKDFVAQNAARFKVPYYVFLRRASELPRVASGKVPKFMLREEALKILAQQGAKDGATHG